MSCDILFGNNEEYEEDEEQIDIYHTVTWIITSNKKTTTRVKQGDKAIYPNKTKPTLTNKTDNAKYEFVGWNKEEQELGSSNFIHEDIIVESNLTLYAVFNYKLESFRF